jgi:hypothetical protein
MCTQLCDVKCVYRNRSTIRCDVALVSMLRGAEDTDEIVGAAPTAKSAAEPEAGPVYDAHSRDSQLARFVFSHALGNSVKVSACIHVTCTSVGGCSRGTRQSILDRRPTFAVGDKRCAPRRSIAFEQTRHTGCIGQIHGCQVGLQPGDRHISADTN